MNSRSYKTKTSPQYYDYFGNQPKQTTTAKPPVSITDTAVVNTSLADARVLAAVSVSVVLRTSSLDRVPLLPCQRLDHAYHFGCE